MRKMSEKHTGKVYDFVTYLLRDHIYCEQTGFVNDLIIFFYIRGTGDNYYKIIKWENRFAKVREWLLITPKLSKFLDKQNEIVIDLEGCNWWGRRSTGDLYEDEVFRKIYRVRTVSLYKTGKGNEKRFKRNR